MGYEQSWLSYHKCTKQNEWKQINRICVDVKEPIIKSAVDELQRAFEDITGTKIVLCLEVKETEKCISFCIEDGLKAEGYHIYESNGGVIIGAADSNGMLYGSFELIRQMQLGKPLKGMDIRKEPVMPLRMLNHWDNMDGSIERGYSGNSFFFQQNEIIVDDRIVTYARLLASIGINAIVINNVNVKSCATELITDRYFDKLCELSQILKNYGVKLFLSLNYAAPMELGELDSADPQSEVVQTWWKSKMKEVFEKVPNLGGFLIKADSEGRLGPFSYGRTHAEGANMLAEAVEPYGGLIIWRCFVYNCKQDWRDQKTDRARSGYDNFIGLDGTFRSNVILQIKNGPMDFQVREPVHPLFGGLTQTNQMLEVQLAQEYTGQQRHVCYLIPMMKEILDFRTYLAESDDRVSDLVSGSTFDQTNCGIAAVANTGNDENWTGHDLAAANFYGFGRLAFEPEASAKDLALEWIDLTYGTDEKIRQVLLFVLMNSWKAYEMYTSPLGIGWMVNPNHHYGPNVDGYEYDRWGTYHRADHLGIGVDRSQNGTGYAKLYREPNASIYDSIENCPDELLLFFHHVPYTHRLKSGKTVIQHIYDTHFEGVELVDEMISRMETLQGSLPKSVYHRMMERFLHQKVHSREWRDQINTYFYRKSGIADEKGRMIY